MLLRIIYTLGYLIFFVGFILKFMHLPFNTFIMIGALVLLIILLIVDFAKRGISQRGLINLSVWLWLLCLVLTIKFLPLSTLSLILATLSSIAALWGVYQDQSWTSTTLLFPTAVISVLLYLMPGHQRYNLVSIRWNQEIDRDYRTWDKYAWFLYQNQEYKQALEASKKAEKLAGQNGNQEWEELAARHQQMIYERSWSDYP